MRQRATKERDYRLRPVSPQRRPSDSASRPIRTADILAVASHLCDQYRRLASETVTSRTVHGRFNTSLREAVRQLDIGDPERAIWEMPGKNLSDQVLVPAIVAGLELSGYSAQCSGRDTFDIKIAPTGGRGRPRYVEVKAARNDHWRDDRFTLNVSADQLNGSGTLVAAFIHRDDPRLETAQFLVIRTREIRRLQRTEQTTARTTITISGTDLFGSLQLSPARRECKWSRWICDFTTFSEHVANGFRDI
jgi:hypothetical protein